MRKPESSLAARLALIAAVMLAAGSAFAGPTTTQFTLTGSVITTPATYTLPTLEALPPITQTVTFTSGGVAQSHTYTGASLWGIVNGAGIINNPNVNNDVLNKYVLATGSDGYKAVFSLGELNPNFGNEANLVAYAETIGGVSAPLGADGFARVTAPGDTKGGRYVSNLTNLDVRGSGSTVPGIGGGLSTQFTVTGVVMSDTIFDLAALEALPATTYTTGSDTYTGTSFWGLLNSVGIVTDPDIKNDLLGMYVVATATDGYKVVFSLGELDPGFGNEPDLIAYELNGNPLDTNGFARLIVPEDVRRGRWLSNLTSLEVFSASPVPEPPTVATLLLGLAMVAGFTRRRPAQVRRPN